ncbi:auxin-responsive protein SAUR71-like [Senna tora]|uniref:Auxin-responsive protein SAUR71-like n=1 Tax=Senna tora TaxID=362788 RepID=A0A834T4A0_9FABA|nr:auxin-responsive protein SAUR71-like [Senna tora]
MGARVSSLRNHLGGSRGYVPICVGVDEDHRRRFMIHTKAFKDAIFCELLTKSAEEYGFQNDGILRILFEAQDFEDWIIKSYNRNKIMMRVKSRRSYPLRRFNRSDP